MRDCAVLFFSFEEGRRTVAEERIRIFAVDVRGLPDIPDPRLSELFPEWRAAADSFPNH